MDTKKIEKKEPVNVIEEVVVSSPPVPKEMRYQLSLYAPNGLLKSSISQSVFTNMSRLYGDIIRSISGNSWSTSSEIIQKYRSLEKRLGFIYRLKRTDEEISQAIDELVFAGLVMKK
jgi:Cdc6-like AAA superfamily ATPase